MFPGAWALSSAPNAAFAENVLTATGTAQFLATAALVAGSQAGSSASPVLAAVANRILLSPVNGGVSLTPASGGGVKLSVVN